MSVYYSDDLVTLHHGDCVEVMRELPEASVDAVVTDPPYGLAFMGKEWDDAKRMVGQMAKGKEQRGALAYGGSHDRGYADHDANGFQVFSQAWAAEALRVLKPGGYLLAFGGTRTWHRLAVAIEDAGFEVRDSIAWMYGSGFPKSLDVSKAIDKRGGATAEFAEFRDAVKAAMKENGVSRARLQQALGNFMLSHYLTAGSQPAIPNWRDYQIIRDCVGLGDKYDDLFMPEAEREVVGRGTSAIANKNERGRHTIGASQAVEFDITAPATQAAQQWQGWGTALKPAFEPIVVARKPLDGTVAENVLRHGTGALNIDGSRIPSDDGFERAWDKPVNVSVHGPVGHLQGPERKIVDLSASKPVGGRWPANVILDESQAAELDRQSGTTFSNRIETSPTTEAGDGWGNIGSNRGPRGHSDQGGASRFFYVPKANASERPRDGDTAHPTVKPLDLMRYLVKLVTPPGGTVLEPFAGSGTTLEACVVEGFHVIGIELTEDYLPLIVQRLSKPIEQVLW